jgi:diguanylate cyclase
MQDLESTLSVAQNTQRLRWGWLMGHDPKLRVRMGQSLLALMLIGSSVIFGLYAGLSAQSPTPLVLAWAALAALGQGAMVVAIRMGWTLRSSDPSLTLMQIVFTLICTYSLYPLMGELRAAALPITILILVFGSFELRPVATALLSLFALVLAGASMFFSFHFGPHRFPASVELAFFASLLISVSGIAILSSRMSRMRSRLRGRSEDLSAALARIEAMAMRDALTGVFNRRHAESLLARAMRRHERSGAPFSVAMLDLDHFKAVNDRHGHAAGDAVLVAVAKAVQRVLRENDTLTRWGGEEFLLLLDDALPQSAAVGVQRALDAVRGTEVPLAHGAITCTFSAGVASLRRGESVAALLQRADEALYRAKAQGRNRVEVDPSEP